MTARAEILPEGPALPPGCVQLSIGTQRVWSFGSTAAARETLTKWLADVDAIDGVTPNQTVRAGTLVRGDRFPDNRRVITVNHDRGYDNRPVVTGQWFHDITNKRGRFNYFATERVEIMPREDLAEFSRRAVAELAGAIDPHTATLAESATPHTAELHTDGAA